MNTRDVVKIPCLRGITEVLFNQRFIEVRMVNGKRSLLFIVVLIFMTCGILQAKQVIKLSIIPHRSHMGNEKAYGKVIESLEKETNYTFQWVGSRTYDDVIEHLGMEKADIGYVGPFAYITARKKYETQLIVRTLDDDKSESYTSMIITRKDSGIKSIQDLKGKSFGFTDVDSTSGFLFPLVGLNKAGISINDFSSVLYLKRHANSLLGVYNGQVNAGAISSTAPNKVKIDFNEIRVLWESKPIYRGPWIARKGLHQTVVTTLRQAMLKISAQPNADELFKDLSTKGFVLGLDADYDNVREVEKLKQELDKKP